jgi:hypothetical protein
MIYMHPPVGDNSKGDMHNIILISNIITKYMNLAIGKEETCKSHRTIPGPP